MKRPQPQRLDDYIRHILTALDNIVAYTVGMDWGAFEADRKTQDAVVRNLEVIGEACNNIVKHHGEFARAHGEIPWSFAYEVRNALSHGYFTWTTRLCGEPSSRICPCSSSRFQACLDRATTDGARAASHAQGDGDAAVQPTGLLGTVCVGRGWGTVMAGPLRASMLSPKLVFLPCALMGASG